jgi:hypothetical protein
MEAQTAAVSGGTGLPVNLSDVGPYTSDYATPLLFGMEGSGRGTQELSLDRSFRPSAWVAIEWFPGERGGLLARSIFRRTPLGGPNTPYQVTLDYTARQPPDFVPRPYHADSSAPWPDTTGRIDRWEFDVLATVTSARSGPRAHIDGGLAIVGTSGSFEPVGLTTAHLGGHSVLFTDRYHVVLGVSRTWNVAAVASGGVTIPLGTRAGIDISGRLVLPRTASAAVTVRSIRRDTAVLELSVDEAQRALQPRPLEFDLRSADLLVGVRLIL